MGQYFRGHDNKIDAAKAIMVDHFVNSFLHLNRRYLDK